MCVHIYMYNSTVFLYISYVHAPINTRIVQYFLTVLMLCLFNANERHADIGITHNSRYHNYHLIVHFESIWITCLIVGRQIQRSRLPGDQISDIGDQKVSSIYFSQCFQFEHALKMLFFKVWIKMYKIDCKRTISHNISA